tara:strand:+ start:1770 stop:2156 length:387 start_codon:yes stop_codon:yes gene_type:complete
MFSNIPLLFSGLTSGMILFQSAIVAPSVFKVLREENAGLFLRATFPKLFLVAAIFGSIQLLLSSFFLNLDIVVVGLVTSVLMTICYLIIPSTNKARDTGNSKKFSRLHSISVSFTLIVLILNLLVFFI